MALRAAVPGPAGDLSQTARGETFRETFVSHRADELLPHQSGVKIEFGQVYKQTAGGFYHAIASRRVLDSFMYLFFSFQ